MMWKAVMINRALISYAISRVAPWSQEWRRQMSFRETLDDVIEEDIRRSYGDIP